MLGWIGRLGLVEAGHVMARFGLDRRKAHRRLKVLRDAWFLEHHALFKERPGVYLATREGLAYVDLRLPVARITGGSYEHSLEGAWLMIELEREFGTDALLTEREIRSRDSFGERPDCAVRLPGSHRGGHARLHFPDFAVMREGGLIAIELERTVKGRARLVGILRAYARARHIERVRYYVTARVEAPLRKAIALTRVESLVDVVPFAPPTRQAA